MNLKASRKPFPFLIGRIRTQEKTNAALIATSMFPFLIGRIRTDCLL